MRLSRSYDRSRPRLLLVGTVLACIYAAALYRFPLLSIYDRPIQNLNKLTNSDVQAGVLLACAVLLLFVAYIAGAHALYKEAGEDNPERRLLADVALLSFPLLFVSLLMFVYPITSLDLYDYVFRGRMFAHYSANPFIATPQLFERDPLFKYIAWRRAVTAYGPFWEGMGWLVSRIVAEPWCPPAMSALPIELRGCRIVAPDVALLRLLFAYKGLGALGFLLCGVALRLALGPLSRNWRRFALYLWFWNPLIVWEAVGAGHNDMWMVLPMLLAVWLLQRTTSHRLSLSHPAPLLSKLWLPILGLILLTAGGLFKSPVWLLCPLYLAASVRQLSSIHERCLLLVGGGSVCAGLIALAYLPFWEGWPTLRHLSDRSSLFNATWLAALQAELAPLLTAQTAKASAAAVGSVGLFLGCCWATWRAWSAPDELPKHMLGLLLWLVLFCNPWFQPWYLLWITPLAALRPQHRAVWAVILFCCTSMLSYGGEAFLLPVLGWDSRSSGWHMFAWLLISGPPLLLLGWSAVVRATRWLAAVLAVQRRPRATV